MDLYSNAQSWTQNLTGATPSTDDWKEQSSTTNGAGVPAGASATQPSLDLSDYDLAGKHPFLSARPQSTPRPYLKHPFNLRFFN